MTHTVYAVVYMFHHCLIFFFFLMIRRPPRSTLFPYNDALPISGEGPCDAGRGELAALREPRGGASGRARGGTRDLRSEEHTSELQSRLHLVCRLLLEKKKTKTSGGGKGPA